MDTVQFHDGSWVCPVSRYSTPSTSICNQKEMTISNSEKFLNDLKEDFNALKRTMKTQPKEHRYELYIPNDLHWILVKLAAEQQMHQEDYVESIIKAHAEEHVD
jgi:hypothetical protein